MGAELITVSTDSVFVHLAWRRDEGELAQVKYKMGSDRTGELARRFGIYNEQFGEAHRGTFVISPEGVLVNVEVNWHNLGRNIDELMRKFKANLHLSRHSAERCPSKWRDDGDRTLSPSPAMVGKVHEALQDG